MANKQTQRGRKPQNKRDVQPEPQNAAKGGSLPNIAQGRPVAVAVEQFMQSEDQQKIEEILEWFENKKSQVALKYSDPKTEEEINSKVENIKLNVDIFNSFDISSEL